MALGLTATRKDSADFSAIKWLKLHAIVDNILAEREVRLVSPAVVDFCRPPRGVARARFWLCDVCCAPLASHSSK
jgi:hypothetical protein